MALQRVRVLIFEYDVGLLRLLHRGSRRGDQEIRRHRKWQTDPGRLAGYLVQIASAVWKDHDFVISRVFIAPRELVFKAFTDPQRMPHWWGSTGFTVISAKMDLRLGGSYHYGMKAPDGGTMRGKFGYREIAVPERLVFINSFSDEVVISRAIP